jgi:uncharacterized protein (DUF1330 family)
MNQHITLTLAVLTGAVVGGIAVGGLNAQTPLPGAQSAQPQGMTQRPRYFVITEQEITDQQRYSSEYAPKVTKTILDHQGRFIVRNDQITHLAGDPAPKRIVILGFDTMDQIQRWQNSADYKELQPVRDQVMKLKQFAVQTCPPSGQPAQAQAQPGATGQPQACPGN